MQKRKVSEKTGASFPETSPSENDAEESGRVPCQTGFDSIARRSDHRRNPVTGFFPDSPACLYRHSGQFRRKKLLPSEFPVRQLHIRILLQTRNSGYAGICLTLSGDWPFQQTANPNIKAEAVSGAARIRTFGCASSDCLRIAHTF